MHTVLVRFLNGGGPQDIVRFGFANGQFQCDNVPIAIFLFALDNDVSHQDALEISDLDSTRFAVLTDTRGASGVSLLLSPGPSTF